MSSKRSIALSGLVAAIVAIGLIAATVYLPGAGIFQGGTTNSGSSLGSQTGTLGIQLTDPPTVPPGVTSVYISYSEMDVHVAGAGNQSGWYQVAPAGEIDLMSILNTSITLGSAPVTTGEFNAIGFNITSATVTVNGVNQSAFISSHKLLVPLVGGVQVASGTSVGVLVDLSPTVLAVTNGSQTAYVLIPNAHSVLIPESVWKAHEHRGDEVSDLGQQKWFEDGVRGNISLSNPVLTNNSLSITVTNNGANSTVISSLTVAYPLNVICQQYAGSCTASPNGDELPKAIPVAQFGILSNGTLLQYNFTAVAVCHYTSDAGDHSSTTSTESGQTTTASSEQSGSEGESSSVTQKVQCAVGPSTDQLESQGIHYGYVLGAGKSVTFTFSGKIATITPDILNYIHLTVAVPNSLINAVSNIQSSQLYVMAVTGPFDTTARAQVTAS
ncbi:MAG: DUF4382 domain-containing protein [Nitrososphaerales archaeon]